MRVIEMKSLSFSAFALILLLALGACNSAVQTADVNGVVTGIAHQFAPDKRTAVFAIETEKTAGALILKGETNLSEAYSALMDSIASLGVEVIDSVRILPDSAVADKPWALVTLSVMPIRKEPSYPAEMVSQAILGTPVKVLDKKRGWYRIQTPDQYIGWAEGAGLESKTEVEIDAWKTSSRYVFTKMNGWMLSEPNDGAANVADLVLGSIFTVNGESKGFLHLQLPDGREGYVKASDCARLEEWENTTPIAENVIETAKKLLGSPYLWGGTSTKGIDCSGFTKTAYFSQGILLARDASQQARYGESLPIDSLDFEPGDLLFFGRSKDHITHVGLYMGNDHFIHSSGRVKINSFNPNDTDFDPGRREQLVAACRVLNSLGTEQITPVKNHPWYN